MEKKNTQQMDFRSSCNQRQTSLLTLPFKIRPYKMGRTKCSAFNCNNSNLSDVKLFKFPLDNRQNLKKWLTKMRWKDWTPSRFSVLCIDHFEEKYIDRTGRFIKLRENAVPTKFSFPTHMEKRKAAINPKSRRYQASTSEASQTNPAQATAQAPPPTPPEIQEPSQTKKDSQSADEPRKFARWTIIMDEELVMIESFPSFFHGDYCIPQAIQWAPDDTLDGSCRDEEMERMPLEDPEKTILVREAWQWLGVDVRGPLPPTLNGHKYILTVTDYYSKWVEAMPMKSGHSSQVTKHIVDIISHFGFPFRLLSRLPRHIVKKINQQLREKLRINLSIVVYHQQTGTLDLITQRLIDRMVTDLVEQHAADWDVYLPAKVFSLCFKKHPQTKERPFSMLCCKGLQPVKTSRGHHYTYSTIQDSTFVVF